MKRLFTLALICVVAASVALADTKMKKAGKPAGTKAGLQQVADDYFASLKTGDAKKISDFFAPDYTFTDLDGKMMSRDDRLKSIAGQDMSKLVFSDIAVRTYGATGVVTGVATNSVDSTHTRFTQTWAWQGGRWWLVAAQRSSITP
jgi:hypothetical protein